MYIGFSGEMRGGENEIFRETPTYPCRGRAWSERSTYSLYACAHLLTRCGVGEGTCIEIKAGAWCRGCAQCLFAAACCLFMSCCISEVSFWYPSVSCHAGNA